MSDVRTLLQQSRAKHAEYRKAANPKSPAVPNYPIAEQRAAEARSLRLDAHALDPDHLDPAWQHDKVPHARYLAFYDRYPGIQDASRQVLTVEQMQEKVRVPELWHLVKKCDPGCKCPHGFPLTKELRRKCVACGCEEVFGEPMKKEDSLAFKQLQQENEAAMNPTGVIVPPGVM